MVIAARHVISHARRKRLRLNINNKNWFCPLYFPVKEFQFIIFNYSDFSVTQLFSKLIIMDNFDKQIEQSGLLVGCHRRIGFMGRGCGPFALMPRNGKHQGGV